MQPPTQEETVVKRYESDIYGTPMQEAKDGYWVEYDAYRSLQAALKEALERLERTTMSFAHPKEDKKSRDNREHIAELRKLLI
jgi:hypothetical protein